MNLGSKIALASAAGAGAFLLFARKAYGTESVGETLPASAGKIPPGTPTTLGSRAVEVGLRYLGVKETSTNSGPEVDEFIRGVYGTGVGILKLAPAKRGWCAAFVRWCFEKAAQEMNLPPPFAGIKDALTLVTSWRDTFKKYETEPKTGAVGLLLKTGIPGVDPGKRHATIVVRVDGDRVTTIEGNHNDSVALVERPRKDFAVFLDIDRYIAEKGRPMTVSGAPLGGLDVFAVGC